MSIALQRIQDQLSAHQRDDPNAAATLSDVQAWCDAAESAVHVAIMVEPYLSKIESGEKYIESRLTKVKISPFDRAAEGDVILFKKSGGAIVAIAEVRQVQYDVLEAPQDLAQLVERYGDGLSYEDGYADSKAAARYASLLWIDGVQQVPAVGLEKRGRQAWLTFNPGSTACVDEPLF